MMINELKMTETKTISWTELEMLVNYLKKKHTKKRLTDVETKILKGIFENKTYRDLAKEIKIRTEEQSIKNAASSLFKILSEQTGEKIGKTNLITALTRYRDNSQIFDHNNKPQPQQSNKVLELVMEVGIDDLTPEKIDKIISFLQETARDNTIKPIMKLKGSIRLFLEGSEEGLKHLADLHQSGELQALLNELKSDDIPEIIVKKAEFTTDAKVIEKAELIKAIREGTIDKKTLYKVDLSGAILSGAILSGADLSGANLRRANLSWAFLSWADLIEADLSWAFLRRADLIDADLSGAKLSGANLNKANLSKANLSWAFMSGANLIGAILSKANLRGAILWGANLSGANLSGANLSGARLSKADLSGAKVENAIFIDATGITPEQKQDLIRRGAIFGDNSNDRSKVLV
ncbi:MAG: pentapeptide repeat-containing protein [Microcystis panniformis]